MLGLHWRYLLQIIKNPLAVIIGNARRAADTDIRYVRFLIRRDSHLLKYVQRQIKTERVAFEKRVGLLVGALDKVGLIPGFLALAVSLSKLEWLKQLVEHSSWIEGVAYGILILYIFAFYAHILMTRLDRAIEIIETALENKND